MRKFSLQKFLKLSERGGFAFRAKTIAERGGFAFHAQASCLRATGRLRSLPLPSWSLIPCRGARSVSNPPPGFLVLQEIILKNQDITVNLYGKRGIRTPGGVSTTRPFQGRTLNQLRHLSKECLHYNAREPAASRSCVKRRERSRRAGPS